MSTAANDLVPVNVFIAGRSYRIRVPAQDESHVRRAVKAADDKISELRRHYAGKDDQDFVAMALIMYATDTKAAGNEANKEDVQEMITQIDKAMR